MGYMGWHVSQVKPIYLFSAGSGLSITPFNWLGVHLVLGRLRSDVSVKDVEPYPQFFFFEVLMLISPWIILFSKEFRKIQLQTDRHPKQNPPYLSAWFGALGWWAQIPSSTSAPIRKLPRCWITLPRVMGEDKKPSPETIMATENWGWETFPKGKAHWLL